MSLARYASPADIIVASLETGRRATRVLGQSDPDVIDRAAHLIRQGATRGIMPQWCIRSAPGVSFTQPQLDHIANAITDGFSSGYVPADNSNPDVDGMNLGWRFDSYA